MLLRSITESSRLRSIWAATTILCNVAAASNSAARSCNSSGSSNSMTSYPLMAKWRQSHDSWLLRFSLPPGRKYLGYDPALPTCISVHHESSLDDGKVLKKSYSPISHPATLGSFDLLVKSYAPQPGGGVGNAICNIEPGQILTGKLKSERVMHGSPVISKRWDRIGLVAGGTGIAPLVQIVRIVLDDPTDNNTKIYLLSINRYEEDILMREELDKLAKEYPDRFFVKYSLTGGKVPENWDGFTGRGSVDMAREALPPPSSRNDDDDGQDKSTMIFVCGTDGFRDTWAGPIARAPPKADGSKGPKIQGPLLGVLNDAGYDASEVFKY